jgi:hypothetical protein
MVPSIQILEKLSKISSGSSKTSESYFRRPVPQHLQAPKNLTNPMPSSPRLSNLERIKINGADLKKKLKKQGKLFANFNIVTKNVFSRKSKMPAKTPKGTGIPPTRDTDTNAKVIGLRKLIKNGSYVYHPRHKKVLILKTLSPMRLVPICQEINPINKYRFMDYVIQLDASCLNDNWADRNMVQTFGGLETIKKVTSLTHNLQEKLWSWQLEDLSVAKTDWARGLQFFPEFKKWALSFSHKTAHKLICYMENKILS